MVITIRDLLQLGTVCNAYRTSDSFHVALRTIISFSVVKTCQYFITIIVSLSYLFDYSTLCFTAQSIQNKASNLMVSLTSVCLYVSLHVVVCEASSPISGKYPHNVFSKRRLRLLFLLCTVKWVKMQHDKLTLKDIAASVCFFSNISLAKQCGLFNLLLHSHSRYSLVYPVLGVGQLYEATFPFLSLFVYLKSKGNDADLLSIVLWDLLVEKTMQEWSIVITTLLPRLYFFSLTKEVSVTSSFIILPFIFYYTTNILLFLVN